MTLPVARRGVGGTVVVLMHWFGSAKSEWAKVTPLLREHCVCVGLDLPGFGDAAGVAGYSVADMADAVRATVEPLGGDKRVLVGHSMSGKVAAVLAAQGMANLAGVVLVAPSPPSPEPMSDAAAKALLSYRRDRASAEHYLDANTARRLTGDDRERAVEAFIAANPAAWRAWIEQGSKEDWSDRVGVLSLPALLVTGRNDTALALPAQQEHTLPHFPAAAAHDLPECGHVIPLEAAGTLAGLIGGFVAAL